MEAVYIEDLFEDEAKISLVKSSTAGLSDKATDSNIITVDFDPCNKGVNMMNYSPDMARKLAAELILVAEKAEVDE